MYRRHFLRSLGLTALMGPRWASAQNTGPLGRRFLFLMADGGWDPLCVFAPQFSSNVIEMEPDAAPWNFRDFSLVDHPERPHVREFFQSWADQTLVINGISTRSIAHDTCMQFALTGQAAGSNSDWPSLIAFQERSQYSLPYLVVSGPSFPANLGALLGRLGGNGQLGSLSNGDITSMVTPRTNSMPAGASSVVDRWLLEQVRALRNREQNSGLLTELETSINKATQLGNLDGLGRVEEGNYEANINVALRALAQGICRTAMVSICVDWDTHSDNRPQSTYFNNLFESLGRLMTRLTTTSGPEGQPLIEDTIVVVMSEMGRTPRFNETGGRDHWPYTSFMLLGGALNGGRSIGGYDDGYIGLGVDPSNGEVTHNGASLAALDFGATLLSLADIDPDILAGTPQPLGGLLR